MSQKRVTFAERLVQPDPPHVASWAQPQPTRFVVPTLGAPVAAPTTFWGAPAQAFTIPTVPEALYAAPRTLHVPTLGHSPLAPSFGYFSVPQVQSQRSY